MKNVILAMIVASFAGFTFAQTMGEEIEIRGEIVDVSKEASTITLEEVAEDATQSGVVRELVVDASTKLTAEGEAIDFEDLRVGARATVRYVMDAGKNVAKSIEVRGEAT